MVYAMNAYSYSEAARDAPRKRLGVKCRALVVLVVHGHHGQQALGALHGHVDSAVAVHVVPGHGVDLEAVHGVSRACAQPSWRSGRQEGLGAVRRSRCGCRRTYRW